MNEYDDMLAADTQANDYDAQIALDQDQARQRLRASMFSAQRQNPDQYGQAKQLERDTGIPASVVARNLPEVQQRVRLNEYDQLLETSPKLAEHLQNPDFASMAHDDAEGLSLLERTVGVFKNTGRALTSSIPSVNASLWGLAQAGVENFIQPITEPLAGTILPEDIGGRVAAKFGEYRQQQDAIAKGLMPKPTGIAESGFYSGVQSLGQNLLTLPLAITTGQPGLALGTMSAQTGGQAYGQARDQGMAPLGSLSFAASQAAIEYATEKLPMHTLLKDLKVGSPFYKTLVHQMATEVPGEEVATLLQDLNEWAALNPDQPFSSYLKERPSAALQTLIATMVASGGQVGTIKAVDTAANAATGRTAQAATAQQDAQTLQQMGEQSKASKLRQRDPQSFQQFVDAAAADGPVQDIYVDARTFAQALQQAGIDPAQLAQVSPSVASQLTEALDTGGDIKIPVGEYAAQIAATPAADALLPHLRTAPDAMSMEEATTFMQSQAEQFKAEAETTLAQHEFDSQTKESAANVERELAEQLKQANRFTDDVNGAYAKLMSAFYTVQATRLGVTPEELYVRYPLQIRSDSVLGGSAMRMDQGSVGSTEGGTLDDVKTAWAESGIQSSISENNDRITLSKIIVPEGERGNGLGTQAMERLVQYAESVGKHIVLSPSEDFGGNKKRLTAFYKRFGFVENKGKNRAFSTTESMYREAPGKVLYQPGSARGNITFGKDIKQTPTIISLLQNADLSTFLHESGHFYLEVLNDMAQQPDAPADVVEDMNRILQWFGVPDIATWNGMDVEQKRPYHEQFARGMEAYLFEGKAPSHEMQGVFARFRAWLVNVYRQLAALNVNLTDEVRGVFNRLLATNDQILAAEAARSYAPLFASAEQAGMTPEEWQQYQALGRDATQEAVDQLQTRSLRDMQWLSNAKSRMLKKLQRDAKAKRTAVEAEVRAEVMAEPINQVRQFLTRGELPDADRTNAERKLLDQMAGMSSKLSLPVLKEMYGEGPASPWRYLTNGKFGQVTAEDGLHPDMVAELFGFSSGDHLVRELLAADSPETEIEGKTDQRMLERYGDLSSPDAIERATNEAIHNEARAKFVATELGALEKALQVRQDTGRTVTDSRGRVRRVTVDVMAKAAKEFAKTTVARRKLRDIKPAQFTVAEARAAKAAEKAIAGTDLVTAATEKRNQMVNGYTAKEAYRALDEIDTKLRYLKRVGDSDSIDISYREQIQAILDRYDLRKITDKEANRRQSLLEWVESQREQNLEPVIDPAVLDEARRIPYREMTLEQFRGLVDSVKNIEHLGRLKKKLLTAKDERDFSLRVDEAANTIRANAKRTLPVQLESNDWTTKLKSGVAEFFAMHRKFANLVREMDGYDDNGVLWNLFTRPMNEAGDREAVLREQATIKLSELFDPVLKAGKMREKVFIPAINASLSREGRIMVALNTGNEGNLQRLMDGDHWTPDQVRAITDTLTKEEWDFVQGVWDFIGSYRDEIGAQQKRLTGVEPEWIEPTPVQTRFGTYRGGYLPAKYDTNRSTRSLADEASANVMDMWRAQRGRAKTRDSFTKGRADSVVDRPLRKDFGVITQHITEVTHRLSWQEYLTDANRLLRASAIDSAIREHYGPEVLKALRDTVQDIAAGEVGAQNAFERGINYLRSGATVAGLGWRLTTALMQPIGLTQSMSRIGVKYVARGVVEWLGDAAKMENTVKRITEKSEMMRLRAKTMQREISEIRNKVSGKDSAIEASYFYMIQKMQLVADVPTWLGQYHKAIENGADEDTARAQADQAVLDAQGGGQIKDLAAIQRGGPLLKLFTNFYSFFNTTYNLTSEAVGRTNFKDPVSVGFLAVDMMLLYSVPAALGTLISAALHGDDDPDKLMRKLISDQLTYLFGTMVGLRELAGGVQTALGQPGDYQGPASVRVFAEMAKLGKQINQGELDEALAKAANNVSGILFHYPAGQINSTVDGIKAWLEGRTTNPGALLVGGPPKH